MLDSIIHVTSITSPASRPIEVVERKGTGHPDTICDAIAENVCRHLCAHYMERFGVVLHHNVDKVLLSGGAARASFGGGEVLAPIEIYLAGRATSDHRGVAIPVRDIATGAAHEWLGAHLPRLDLERDVRIHPLLRGGSSDLTSIFARGGPTALANDTSCGVAFAPFTDLERTVLAAERALNATAVRIAHPSIGEDVKIMGIRRDDRIELTVACAIVAAHVASIEAYEHATATARAIVLDAARAVTACDVRATVNAGDDRERGHVFLTVTGTSAEAGDDGEVGRGNRASGLITPYRPMTLEATAGKNPVSHSGKLYNVLAAELAKTASELPGVRDANAVLVSLIGRPIDEPLAIDVGLALAHGGEIDGATSARVASAAREVFASIDVLRERLLSGAITLF